MELFEALNSELLNREADRAGSGPRKNEEFNDMRRSNFALRLQPALLEELRKAAEAALRTEEYFQQRSRRADRVQTLRISGESR